MSPFAGPTTPHSTSQYNFNTLRLESDGGLLCFASYQCLLQHMCICRKHQNIQFQSRQQGHTPHPHTKIVACKQTTANSRNQLGGQCSWSDFYCISRHVRSTASHIHAPVWLLHCSWSSHTLTVFLAFLRSLYKHGVLGYHLVCFNTHFLAKCWPRLSHCGRALRYGKSCRQFRAAWHPKQPWG